MLREYIEWIGLDLAFQDIDAELHSLPGDYVPPRGALFVAATDAIVGMIGLRELDDETCEMKRLFVRPAARGQGLARQLIARGFSVEVIERLKDEKVEEMVLRFLDDKFAHIATGGA